MKSGRFLQIIIISLMTLSAEGAQMENLNHLSNLAKGYVESQLPSLNETRYVVNPGQLDSRLRLPKCPTPVEAFLAPGSQLKGNTTVGLRCLSGTGWSIYVPVRIAIYAPVLVTNRRISRGELLSESDLTLTELDVSNLRGEPFTDLAAVIGTKAKKPLSESQVLESSNICLICKGDIVTINAGNDLVRVQVSGTAMSDGSRGELIRVQNNESKRIVDARVTSNSEVRVN